MSLMVLRASTVRLELYLDHSMGKYHVSLIFLMPIVSIFGEEERSDGVIVYLT